MKRISAFERLVFWYNVYLDVFYVQGYTGALIRVPGNTVNRLIERFTSELSTLEVPIYGQ